MVFKILTFRLLGGSDAEISNDNLEGVWTALESMLGTNPSEPSSSSVHDFGIRRRFGLRNANVAFHLIDLIDEAGDEGGTGGSAR